jgi:hypothetical protein
MVGILIPDNVEKDSIHSLERWCRQAASDPNRYTKDGAAKAQELLNQLLKLKALPESSLKEKKQRQARLASWKKRAVAFRNTLE